MFKDILLPTDGSQGVEEAINCAIAIAKKFDSRIHVLYVIEPPRFGDLGLTVTLGQLVESLQEAGREIVSRTARSIRDMGVVAVEEVIREGHPAEEIVTYAREKGIDLIAMGTHGRRGINRLLLGSIAEEVARTADMPVLIVRMSPEA
jgi:nucleotide-binding universal stress UspA family protein